MGESNNQLNFYIPCCEILKQARFSDSLIFDLNPSLIWPFDRAKASHSSSSLYPLYPYFIETTANKTYTETFITSLLSDYLKLKSISN